MKSILISLIVFLFVNISSAQQLEFDDFVLYENCPVWARVIDFDLEIELIVKGAINPFYLEADFNGEGMLDIAIVVHEKASNKRGILIVHSETKETFLLGAGTNFGNGGDDFEWIDVWQVYRKKLAYQTLFTDDFDIAGSKEVHLQNIALDVSSSEASSNLVTWDGSKYIWIHTGD